MQYCTVCGTVSDENVDENNLYLILDLNCLLYLGVSILQVQSEILHV